MKKIVVGFDAKRIVRNGTGLGSYGRTLVNDLARRHDCQFRLYAPDEGRADLREQILKSDHISFCYPQGRQLLGKSWWRTRGMVDDLKRDGVQVFHGLSGELPIGIHRTAIRSVVTIHDLIFMRHPEFYHWVDTKLYEWKFRQTVCEADHIIAISERTKRDIMELGRVCEDRITVIYQSFSPRFSTDVEPPVCDEVRHRYTLPQRYVLNVGTIEARKNILQAVKALPLLPNNISLVVVGRPTKYADQVIDYVRKHGLESRVLLLHGVPDEHLPALYAMAETFVYPSVYEGFGIPIIEAISCGLPIVACTGSCLEEAGGPDALYVAPGDVEAMATAISRTLIGADGREERIAKSRQYIRRFEGADVAGQVYNLYERLLSNH